jgi:hypothetical protein
MKSAMKDHDVFERGMLLIDMSSQELREVYSGLYPSMLRSWGLAQLLNGVSGTTLNLRGYQWIIM